MRQEVIQKAPEQAKKSKPNLTGIPTQMKLDFERRSGLSFDDVRVHYNSDKPRKIGALAYTQIPQVHIGPGQERHLRHELGHVVQQKQGIVRPNRESTLDTPINTDPLLERQADLWGDSILASGGTAHIPQPHLAKAFGEPVLQAKYVYTKEDLLKDLPVDATKVQDLKEEICCASFNEGSLTMIYESMGTDERSFSAILAETEKYNGNTLLVFGLNMKCGSFQEGSVKFDKFEEGIVPFRNSYCAIQKIIRTHGVTRLVSSPKAATATAKKPPRPEAATATAKKPPRPEAATATAKKPPRPEAAAAAAKKPPRPEAAAAAAKKPLRPEAAAAAATSSDTAGITDYAHNVCLFPFWWVTPKNTKGYDMPFVEARSLIMQKAAKYAEDLRVPAQHLYRWIDGDARDDRITIKDELAKKVAEHPGAVIITGSYFWRTTQSEVTKEYASFIDDVNSAERKLRAYYYQLKVKDEVTLSDGYDPDAPIKGMIFRRGKKIEGFYLPETVFMMNSAAHSLAENVGDHILFTDTQDKESMKTLSEILEKSNVRVFPLMTSFVASKPIKNEFSEASYWGRQLVQIFTNKDLKVEFPVFCKALKNLRQSAFDNSHWHFLSEYPYCNWETPGTIKGSPKRIEECKQILLNQARYKEAISLASNTFLQSQIKSIPSSPC